MSIVGTATRNLALTITALSIFGGCAAPEPAEEQGYTTSKLLKAEPAAELPAADAQKAAAALGGVPLAINAWEGYVAGTDKDALFVMHLSGLDHGKPVAGLSFAFVEDATGSGDLGARLGQTSTLEVRFNNGSGLVASHSFGGGTTAAHADDADSKALLARAFNDAEALLRAPLDSVSGDESTKACVANYLTTVSDAARCVDDPSNTLECGRVRADAVLVASSCQNMKTANILASTNTISTKALPGGLSGIFDIFTKLQGGTGGIGSLLGGLTGGTNTTGTPGGLGSLLGGLTGGSGTNVLSGLLGSLSGKGTGGLFGTLLSFLPKLFSAKNAGGLSASPLNGLISLLGKK